MYSTSGATKWEHPFIERFFDVRPEEFGRVLLMSAYLLLIIAAYSTAKAVRDSLFVTKIGPSQLPYVYLMIAGVMGLVSVAYTRAVARIGLRKLIRATSLIAISNLLMFWLLFKQNSPLWFYVLYVWVSLFGAITASQFWLFATHVFNPREARRVFTWLGVGGILGGILGGALTNRVANWFGTESLLIVCVLMIAATIVLLEHAASFAQGAVEPKVEPVDVADGGEDGPSGRALYRQVRESRHLRLIVLLLTVAVIVEAFIDYQYKFVAKQSFTSKDNLTAFFGTITFYVGIFSLLFQMLITNRILKRLGVAWAIGMLPAGLLISFALLAVHPNLWAVAVLQLVDGGFSYSIHRSGMELLYLPIAPQTRNRVKGFIDMFVDRAGRAAGAVLLLVLTAVLSFSISTLSLFAVALVVAWIGMVIAVKRQYVHSFRQALEKTVIEPEALQLRNLDTTTTQTLKRLLSSDDERRILYALDLLSNTHPDGWRDRLDMLIHHPAAAVRARTIALLTWWNDPSVTREEFLNHPDYETARVAMAGALRLHWSGSPGDRTILDCLLRDSSPNVARQAIVTAGLVQHEGAVPILIEKLADRRVRQDSREALVKFGGAITAVLALRLFDPRESMRIRTCIPKTLALAGTQDGANILTRALHRFNFPLDFEVLKALNKLHAGFPQIRLDTVRIVDAIHKEREIYDHLRNVQTWLKLNATGDPVSELLMRAVAERMEQRLERIFRLVGLVYSQHDIHAVYYNCQVKPALRASAIEFLDNLLDVSLKQIVIPLLEEGRRGTTRLMPRKAVFQILLEGRDPWLKTIAREFVSNEARNQCVKAC
jgi:ATP/ADP translocase